MSLRSFRDRSRDVLRDNKPLGVAELAVAVLVLVGGLVGVIPFSSTPFLLLLGWLSLWLRGVGWRGVGLRRPASWRRVVLLGVVAGAAFQYFSLYVRACDRAVHGRVAGRERVRPPRRQHEVPVAVAAGVLDARSLR